MKSENTTTGPSLTITQKEETVEITGDHSRRKNLFSLLFLPVSLISS